MAEISEETYFEDSKYRIVLCGASAYDKKYYFNHKFDKLPENVKEELNIICVLFTEEVGGIFTISFTPLGEIVMDTAAEEGDLLYDEIGSGLLIKKIRQSKQEVFEAISIYYKVQFLHMDPSKLMDDDGSGLFDDGEETVHEEPKDTFHRVSTPEDFGE